MTAEQLLLTIGLSRSLLGALDGGKRAMLNFFIQWLSTLNNPSSLEMTGTYGMNMAHMFTDVAVYLFSMLDL